MKRIAITILAVLLLILHVQPAAAASNFSLKNGQLTSERLAGCSTLFENTLIIAEYSPQKGNYTLTGEGIQESTYDDPLYVRLDQAIINISGTYDPLSGSFSGTFHLDIHNDGKSKDKQRLDDFHYQNLLADGDWTATANPGDTSVEMVFKGTGDDILAGRIDVSFTVTFAVEGTLPFPQEPTDEPEPPQQTASPEPEAANNYMQELLDRVKTPAEDSGIRFSDLSGQVEVCMPLGFDENGKPVYDDEDWTFAKLDMKLPYGTKVKTTSGIHPSSFMLSFPDMTTLITKGEEDTWQLPVDPKIDPEMKRPSTLKLLVGMTWVNFKKMALEGSMDIEMSQAVAGIKGTTFVLEDDGETSTLKVIEGTVEYTSKATAESVFVEAGKMVSATEDGLGDIHGFDVKAEMEDWELYGTEMPSGFPLWAILAISGAVLLVVLIVVIVVYKKRHSAVRSCPHPPYTPNAYPPPVQNASAQVPGSACTQCGTPLSPGAAFCTKCGKRTS